MQNRNKLINSLIGNLSNAVLHAILEKAISEEEKEIATHYNKELKTSFDVARRYRDKINPKFSPLLEKDAEEIKSQIMKNVKNELLLRISKGYKNINLNLIEKEVDSVLRLLKV
ncbi:MAG: hypothetical protein NTX24_01475 [Candidatus Pacearchaeota archaeon]|nr:hypothetical protein [Candidatus Pacearchaeota archaeon]